MLLSSLMAPRFVANQYVWLVLRRLRSNSILGTPTPTKMSLTYYRPANTGPHNNARSALGGQMQLFKTTLQFLVCNYLSCQQAETTKT